MSGVDVAGGRAVFLLDPQLFSGRVQLFSAPLDGSAPKVRLNAPLPIPPAGAPAASDDQDVYAVGLLPQGRGVVYTATLGGATQLFRVPLDASAGPLQLNPPLVAGGNVLPWVAPPVLADGHVLYIADQRIDGKPELFSVPDDGSGPAVRINRNLTGSQVHFSARAVNGRVVYLAPQERHTFDLFVAPLDGSPGPIQVNPPGSLALRFFSETPFALHPDRQRLLFLASQGAGYELFESYLAHPARRSGAPVPLR